MNPEVNTAKSELATFCQAHGIRRLAIFGSALRSDFGPASDIDVLIELATDRTPGLLGIVGMEIELSALFGDRKVDLRTPELARGSTRRPIAADRGGAARIAAERSRDG